LAGKIAVTSQYLREKQGEWAALLGQAQESFLAAVVDAEKLRQHFWGDPVRELRKEFVSLGEEGTAAFGRMRVHIQKLEEIADVYENGERSNVNVTPNH